MASLAEVFLHDSYTPAILYLEEYLPNYPKLIKGDILSAMDARQYVLWILVVVAGYFMKRPP